MVKFTFLPIPPCRLESTGDGERLLIGTNSSVSFSLLFSSFVLIEHSYSTTRSWYIATYRFHLSRVFNEIYDERKSEDVCSSFECDDDDDDDDLYMSPSVHTNSPLLSLALVACVHCVPLQYERAGRWWQWAHSSVASNILLFPLIFEWRQIWFSIMAIRLINWKTCHSKLN